VVELLGVVVHGPSSLLEFHELMALLPHHDGGDVVGAEGITELNPRYLVVCGVSGSIVGPPHAGIATQLLRGKEGLLHFGAVQEPNLVLHHPKPVIGLERLSCLDEERRVSGQSL
jgi:hypothetical protein